MSIKPPGFAAMMLLISVGGLFFLLLLPNPFLGIRRHGQLRTVSMRDLTGKPVTYDTFRRIAQQLNPTVVTIYTTTKRMAPFHNFLGGNPFEEDFDSRSVLGSGFIADGEGYILTNNHVVEDAAGIDVSLDGGHSNIFHASVVQRNRRSDIALLRIHPNHTLQAAPLGDSGGVEVGDWVIAIGNPFNLDHTVTVGIVSAKGRALGSRFSDFIQTDASINPGNSGGPLLNAQGQVVGINTAIYTTTGQSEGIGFAIPIDRAKDLMP